MVLGESNSARPYFGPLRSAPAFYTLIENMRRQGLFWLGFLVAVTATYPLIAIEAQSAEKYGNITGFVRDSSGQAIARVRITVPGTNRQSESDEQGHFRLRLVAAGRAMIELQRFGFLRKTTDVLVHGGRTTEVVIVLAAVAQSLAPARISAAAAPPQPTGRFAEFDRRRSGAFGHFITREEIERQHAMHFTDILRLIPGVRIAAGFAQSGVRLRGARCPPHVWIDGTPAGAAEFNLDAIPLQTVQGVEVYSGVATVPAELMAGRARGRCGVIVVWTRIN